MTRLLIAGAGGFIGSHIVRSARADGVDAVALVRTPRHEADIAADLVTADLERIVAGVGPDVVINAASYGVGPDQRDPERMFAVNVLAAHRLLTAAQKAGVPRFIHLGSYSEYGDHPAPITEDGPLRPKDAYGATKAATSLLVAGAPGGIDTVVLRLFNVWGPGEAAHRLLPQVVAHCRAGTRLALTSGSQVKDWAFAPDLARWIVALARSPSPFLHRIMNVSSGFRASVRDLALTVARALNGEHHLAFGAKATPASEAQTGPADLTRFAAALPDRHLTPLDEAVAALLKADP